MKKRPPFAVLGIPALLLLAACSGQGVRGVAPFVQINGVTVGQPGITMDIGVRNANSVALEFQQIQFSIKLDETSLAIYNAASQATVPANGTENLRFEVSPLPAGSKMLAELENGQRASLEYTLEGAFTVLEEGHLEFKHKGHLYPVPGRPGQFR